MTKKQFLTLRLLIVIFISVSVSIAYSTANFKLAIAAILVGMLFIFLVKKKSGQIKVDERIISISGQAARLTYSIFTIILAAISLVLMFYGKANQDYFYESLGTIMSYAVMANLLIYSFAYHYYNNKYGGDK